MVIAVTCIIQAASAYEDAILSIELSNQSVSQGSTFTANITVDPVDNEVHYAGYTILFDKDMMNVISQTQGNFLSQDGADTLLIETYNNTVGKAEYDETRNVDYGVTNPGILASITFNVTGSAGTGSLNFSSTTMGGNFNPYGNPINVTTYNATFIVPKPFQICGYVSYENGSACNNPGVNITNLNTSRKWATETSGNYYQITLTSGTDLNATEVLRFDAMDGVYSSVTNHTITAGEVNSGGLIDFNLTITSLKMGDVNGDGEITSADAVIVLRMAVRGEHSDIADVSRDGSVTSLDALMIQQAAMNNIRL